MHLSNRFNSNLAFLVQILFPTPFSLSTPPSQILTSDNPTLFEYSLGALTPDHEELVTMESVEEEEAGEEMEKDPPVGQSQWVVVALLAATSISIWCCQGEWS